MTFDFWRDLGGHPNPLAPQVEIQKSETERLFLFGSSNRVKFHEDQFRSDEALGFFHFRGSSSTSFWAPLAPLGVESLKHFRIIVLLFIQKE